MPEPQKIPKILREIMDLDRRLAAFTVPKVVTIGDAAMFRELRDRRRRVGAQAAKDWSVPLRGETGPGTGGAIAA